MTGLPDKLCTVYLVRPDSLWRARFMVPGDIRDGLRANRAGCWVGVIRHVEAQLAEHLANEG